MVYSRCVFIYILPKCAKTREPKDEHCVLQCPSINTCDPVPLDNLKNYTALQYITWGSSRISKIRQTEIPSNKLGQAVIWDFKIKKEIPIEIFHQTRKKSYWK